MTEPNREQRRHPERFENPTDEDVNRANELLLGESSFGRADDTSLEIRWDVRHVRKRLSPRRRAWSGSVASPA